MEGNKFVALISNELRAVERLSFPHADNEHTILVESVPDGWVFRVDRRLVVAVEQTEWYAFVNELREEQHAPTP